MTIEVVELTFPPVPRSEWWGYPVIVAYGENRVAHKRIRKTWELHLYATPGACAAALGSVVGTEKELEAFMDNELRSAVAVAYGFEPGVCTENRLSVTRDYLQKVEAM